MQEKETAHILPQWREEYEFSFTEFERIDFMYTYRQTHLKLIDYESKNKPASRSSTIVHIQCA